MILILGCAVSALLWFLASAINMIFLSLVLGILCTWPVLCFNTCIWFLLCNLLSSCMSLKTTNQVSFQIEHEHISGFVVQLLECCEPYLYLITLVEVWNNLHCAVSKRCPYVINPFYSSFQWIFFAWLVCGKGPFDNREDLTWVLVCSSYIACKSPHTKP